MSSDDKGNGKKEKAEQRKKTGGAILFCLGWSVTVSMNR
jgi:hypothetical protein